MKYECYVCGCKEVGWDDDYDAVSEAGMENEGIVHNYHCHKCGAEYIVFESFENNKNEGKTEHDKG